MAYLKLEFYLLLLIHFPSFLFLDLALPRAASILTATALGPVMVAASNLATALFRSRY
jgi:hypothetical protein